MCIAAAAARLRTGTLGHPTGQRRGVHLSTRELATRRPRCGWSAPAHGPAGASAPPWPAPCAPGRGPARRRVSGQASERGLPGAAPPAPPAVRPAPHRTPLQSCRISAYLADHVFHRSPVRHVRHVLRNDRPAVQVCVRRGWRCGGGRPEQWQLWQLWQVAGHAAAPAQPAGQPSPVQPRRLAPEVA